MYICYVSPYNFDKNAPCMQTSKGMIGYKHLLEKNIFPHHAAYLQLQFSLL